MIAVYPGSKQTNHALRSTRSMAGLALRRASGMGGVGNTQTGAAQTAAAPRFDWNALINQGLQFTRDILTLRPAQGTVITQTPTGGIQVARGADGQPINYQAGNIATSSQTAITGNLGAGVIAQGGLGTAGTTVLLVGGALLLVVMLSRR